jgi:putative hydrolase of HD superfamily
MSKEIQRIVDFIFEAGTANNILRSHHQDLPQSRDTIASHSFRTALIGLLLAETEKADKSKIVLMCLLHDLAELRTGDANFINKFYRTEKEEEAIKDQWSGMPGEAEISELLSEYNQRKTKESLIAKDADMLDQIFLQKEYLGNRPEDLKLWHEHMAENLKTSSAKEIAESAFKTNPLKWIYDLNEARKRGEKNHVR